MTPLQWTMFALAFVIAAPAVVALLYAMCRAAGEADDRADKMLEDIQNGYRWSHK